MGECLHLDAGGRRCRREAVPDGVFCPDHELAGALAPESAWAELRRLLVRLVALGLLALFLFPLLYQAYKLLRELFN